MKWLAVLVTVAGAGCSGGYAATDPRTGTQVVALQNGLVPPGARMWLRLDAPIDDDAPAGVTFSARVAGDVRTTHGEVLIPRGAPVVGRVVAGPWLVVESVRLSGVVQPLAGWVVGVEPPAHLGDEAPDRRTADEGLDDDLPAGTRLELRLVAPAAPMPERDA
jgi:hypothetical protein